MNTELHDRLDAAVRDTTVPPGLARAAMTGGRRRRRRRVAGTLALATVTALGAATFATSLGDAPRRADRYAAGGVAADAALYDWAGSLPEGDPPALPYFAYGKLWSGETGVELPPDVQTAVGPWAVDGGWIVLRGATERELTWSVLGPDGALRDLPPGNPGVGDPSAVAVSPDGRRFAYENLIVDVTTLDTTELPHSSARGGDAKYLDEVRPLGFTEEGLVYQAAPFAQGLGTTYLLRADFTAVRVDPPADTHVPDGSPADIAVSFDYADDDSDTCVTSYQLAGETWAQDGTGCLGEYLGEALSISPDGRWLLTDDLPRVWDLRAGEFRSLDLPREALVARGAVEATAGIVWESADAFLLPVTDRVVTEGAGSVDFDEYVRIVRCTVSKGECELADMVENRVTDGLMSTTAFHFATQ